MARYVSKELEVHEESVGLYHTDFISATTLTSVIQDDLMKLNLSFDILHGQFYNGVSAMSSSKRGVANKISKLEPRTVYTSI